MYLQLGPEISVRTEEIIGVFSINTAFCCEDSSEFLKISDEEGFVYDLCDDIKKSVVIAEINKNSKIFLSPISSSTLIKRIYELENSSI